MNWLGKLVLSFFAAMLAALSLPAQSVQIISQNTIASGDNVPMIFRFLTTEGRIDSTLTTTITLLSGSAVLQSNTVRIVRGAGSLTTRITASNDFSISVAGYTGSKTIAIESARTYTRKSGTLSASQTWTSSEIYRISDDLKIPDGVQLTIGQGTRVYLDADVNILVDGGLIVQGADGNPVNFLPYDASDWGGIEYQASRIDANLNWAIFSGGGGDRNRIFGHSESQPVLKVVSSNLKIDNCFFIDNEGKAIGTHDSNNTVTNCLLSRCDTGAEFRYSTTVVNGLYSMFMPDEDNLIEDDDNDGMYFWSQSNSNPKPHQLKNIVIFGTEDDGIDFNSAQEAIIENVFIGNIYDKGISTTGTVLIQVSHSIFAYCGKYGIAFKDDCEVEIDNSTFYNNQVDIKAFSPDLGNGEGKLHGHNLIFAETKSSIFDIDRDARFTINYSISNTTALNGTGNLFGDPLMTDPEGYRFSLNRESPAIDTGDPNDPPDPDGSRSDMGAIAFDHRTDIHIQLTEINYKPMVNGQETEALEFFEMLNTGDNVVDLGGFFFTGDIQFTFASPTYFQPGSYMLLTRDKDHWTTLGGSVFQWTTGSLGNEEGNIRLNTPEGKAIFSVTYLNESPWPVPTVIHNYPIELKDPGSDFMNPAEWRLSRHYGGTPGKDNASWPHYELVVNEVMPDNGGMVQDPSGATPDWIELYNAGNSPLNVGGLYLSNSPAQPGLFMISDDNYDQTTLASGGFIIFWASGNTAPGDNYLNFTLNSSADEVTLARQSDGGFQYLDEVDFSDIETDVSYARIPDGHNLWTITTVPTPGAPNREAHEEILEGLYINEFLARNATILADEYGNYGDWIEIYNATPEAVNLSGLYLTDNINDLLKYRIPGNAEEETTVAGYGYILFWADARPENGALHADFQLANNGEAIVLSQILNGQVQILDEITFQVQLEDVSFGRFPDGTDNWEYFDRPTPLERNSSNAVNLYGDHKDVEIRVFPNPASGLVYLQKVDGSLDISGLAIYSHQGKLIRQLDNYSGFQQGEQTMSVNLTDMKPGIYFLVFQVQGRRIAKKIILSGI